MEKKYKKTLYACLTGYVVQAIVNNFVPLLFLTFHSQYGISLSKITMLITFNFVLQLVIDFLSAGFIDRIGYRASAVLAHVFATLGLVLLTVLPEVCGDAFTGLLIAVMVYAVGGGLLEVLVSPIVEALPSTHKDKTMSLLHSFYCWGHVGVVLLSTLFFQIFGIENWKFMALLWAIVPLVNGIFFTRVPILSLLSEEETGLSAGELIRKPVFWVFMVCMLCAGASEQAVSQWASTFAEQGLGVTKALGDLMGPMFFAILMGTARGLYGKYGDKIDLYKTMQICGVLCACSYLLISLAPLPALSLLGCGICGFAVGIMWPGTFSIAASKLRRGGTLCFAFLALAGDLGCAGGPTFVGLISGSMNDNLKAGILAAVIFPLLLVGGVWMVSRMQKSGQDV
ncbi:MAG: MFS transporter [Roseburia sp.]